MHFSYHNVGIYQKSGFPHSSNLITKFPISNPVLGFRVQGLRVSGLRSGTVRLQGTELRALDFANYPSSKAATPGGELPCGDLI